MGAKLPEICPYCKCSPVQWNLINSVQISRKTTVKQDNKEFSVKKGILGTALFGPIGAAMGINGKNKPTYQEVGENLYEITVQCEDCSGIYKYNSPEEVFYIPKVAGRTPQTSAAPTAAPGNVFEITKELIRDRNIRAYTIPDTVSLIGKEAFWLCNELQVVTMGKNVSIIEEKAFSGCKNLKSIVLPESLTEVGEHAFFKCENLTEITIKSQFNIQKSAFAGCSGVTKLTFFTNPKKEITKWFSKSVKEVVIQKGVDTIERNVFSCFSQLENVTICDGVEKICDGAFSICEKLQSITLPDSIKEIEYNAFCDCTSLQQVKLPNGLKKIELTTFRECSNLKSITIPDSVSEIDGGAFSDCTSLAEVILPPNIKFNGNPFENTPWLEKQRGADGAAVFGSILLDGKNVKGEYTIPDNITNICGGAFCECKELTSVVIPKGTDVFGFNDCESLEKATILDGAEKILRGAFSYCVNLKGITIPDSVVSIEKEAFEGCENIKKVRIPKKFIDEGLVNSIFENCDNIEFE